LAEREFSDGASLQSAQAHFSEYLQRFGSADDAWLIGLRLGQVEQARGRHRDAVSRFADVTRGNAAAPIVRALAAAYAARASEDAGDFASALPYYRAAAAAWTPDIDDTLALDLPQPLDTPPADIGDILLATNPAEVSREDVDRRIRELARALPAEGGLELERGRWLLRRERPREALPVLERVASRYPRSPAGADARAVVSRARLDAALALADASTSSSDPQTALRELEALSRGAFDAYRGMAGILAATLTLLQGRSVDADAQLTGSLQRWVREASRMRMPASGSLEHDVLAIRDALFLPLGGKSLTGNWNGFVWPRTLPPFVVAPSALRVRVAGSDEWASVDVSRQPPGFTNAVFILPDDMAYLTRAVSRVGGTQRREPTAIMQVPNQPIGDAQTIIRWWNRFFPARPGHWVGFEIATYPAFFSIQFTNAERSRAVVPVTIGYAGADVVMEKVNGAWAIKEVVNRWVT
jgi:tetratricopeptide (TPR) repeat protein